MNTNDILSLSSMLSKPEPEIKGSGQKSEFNPGSIGSKNVLPPKEIPKDRDPLTAHWSFKSEIDGKGPVGLQSRFDVQAAMGPFVDPD